MGKNYNGIKSNTVNRAAEDEADVTGENGINDAFTEDALLPNVDDILEADDVPDLGFYDSKAISEASANGRFTENPSTQEEASLADLEGDSTQGGGWHSSQPEYDLGKNYNGIKSNTVNLAAPGEEEGSGDPDSPGDLTDWSSTLEPSGTPQMYEDPTLMDPSFMENPGTLGQGFDEPLDV